MARKKLPLKYGSAVTEAESDPLGVSSVGNIVEISEKNPVKTHDEVF
jgi:hypothetical protein